MANVDDVNAVIADPKFVDVIVRTWQEFSGKKAVRESDGLFFDELSSYQKE